MKIKCHIILINIVFTLLLTACAAPTPGTPAASLIETTIAQTHAAEPTSTVTSTSTALPTSTPTTTPSLTPEPTFTITPPIGLVASLPDVRQAVIRIVPQGSFISPAGWPLTNAVWAGSGFIISRDGLAVTNNHVVTGAGLIEVWVNGEDQPRHARVLGTSECSDLSVIDIDGEGFRYFEWYNGPLDVGLDVYAAGYPLGEPEFALTRGIISRLKPELKTPWAAVESVLEHDAHLSPGNSGGPLLTLDGRVVGVNYAGSLAGQFYAIDAPSALDMVDKLRSGQDVEAIGINGEVISDYWLGTLGLWVASIEPGSPADAAGIRAGDLITMFGGLGLDQDETLATYCDVLRSHGAEDVIDFEVLRDGQTGKGQINGRTLEFKGNNWDLFPTLAPEVPTLMPEPTSDAFQTVRDDSASIEVSVPSSWTDIDGSAWFDDYGQEIGAQLSASPDLISWSWGWETSGVFIGVSSDLATSETVNSLLDNESWEECQFEGRYDHDDTQFMGAYDKYIDCGGPGGATLTVLVAQPKESITDYLLVVQLTQLAGEGGGIFEELMKSLIIHI
jgi:serine protease Do